MAKIAQPGARARPTCAEELEQVPQMFVEDTRSVSRTTLIEEPFRPVVKRKIEALRGLDFAAAPPLLGLCQHQGEGGRRGVPGDIGVRRPILVRWQYGLGRTVLFASDVKNRWAAEWLHWDGYGKFWAQLVRDTMRRDSGEALRFRVEREGERGEGLAGRR